MAKKKTEEQVVTKQVVRTRTKAVPMPVENNNKVIRINDDGNINLDGMSKNEIVRYTEISKLLNEKDLSSVMSYGSDLQDAMGKYSNEFLKHTLDSNTNIESTRLLGKLLNKIKEVDIDELKSPTKFLTIMNKIPLLRRLFNSVDKVKSKYDIIESDINKIVSELEAARQIAIRDSNLMQKQFEGNVEYVDEASDYIIAGKLKSNELQKKIETMVAEGNYEEYEICDLEEFKNYLDKRINDLMLLRFAFKKSLVDIRIIQRTNIMSANNTEQHIKMTIPFWQNQISVAVALCDQKKIIDMNSMMSNTTNELVIKNSEMTKNQAVEATRQNQRSIVDIEALKKATQNLIETVEGIKKVQEEGMQKRIEAENELKKLEQSVNNSAIQLASTRRMSNATTSLLVEAL